MSQSPSSGALIRTDPRMPTSSNLGTTFVAIAFERRTHSDGDLRSSCHHDGQLSQSPSSGALVRTQALFDWSVATIANKSQSPSSGALVRTHPIASRAKVVFHESQSPSSGALVRTLTHGLNISPPYCRNRLRAAHSFGLQYLDTPLPEGEFVAIAFERRTRSDPGFVYRHRRSEQRILCRNRLRAAHSFGP